MMTNPMLNILFLLLICVAVKADPLSMEDAPRRSSVVDGLVDLYNNLKLGDYCRAQRYNFLPLTKLANGKVYYIQGEIFRKWDDAKRFCESYDMQLAVLTSGFETSYIANEFIKLGISDYVFIALTDRAYEDTFIWEYTNEATTFTNWDTNEPAGTDPDEDCVIIDVKSTVPTSLWAEHNCDHTHLFLCKVPDQCANLLGLTERPFP